MLLISCGWGVRYNHSVEPMPEFRPLTSDDVLTVVVDEPTEKFSAAYSTSLYRCVNKHLSDLQPELTLMHPKELYRQVGKVTQWQKKLSEPEMQTTLAELGLTHLILVQPKFEKGQIEFAAEGDGMGGFIGIARDYTTSFDAYLVDLESGSNAAKIDVSATDSTVAALIIIHIIPIPFYKQAVPTSKACDRFGEETAKFLSAHY